MKSHTPLLFIGTALATASLLGGCISTGGTQNDSAAAKPAATTTAAAAPAANAAPKIGPGMDASGNVIDSKKVEAGFGQKVKGLEDWEGEITGRPAAGSKFSQLKIGMSAAQVSGILGQPNDQGAHPTGKAFIPFYFGSDKYRYEAVYKGQGRLLFASGASFGWDANTHLIWIIHNPREGATR
jgi:hypothetical protein